MHKISPFLISCHILLWHTCRQHIHRVDEVLLVELHANHVSDKIMNTCALYSNIPASNVKWSLSIKIHTVRVTLGYSNQKLYKF